MSHTRRTRSLVVSTIAITLLGFGAVISACGETRGSLGDPCLKSQDCLSNICASQTCGSDPPLLDGAPPPTEAAAEAATDGAGEGGEGGDGAVEAGDAGADG